MHFLFTSGPHFDDTSCRGLELKKSYIRLKSHEYLGRVWLIITPHIKSLFGIT